MNIKRLLTTMLLSILIINCLSPKIVLASETTTNKKAKKTDEDYSKYWPKGPSIDADSAILMDLSTGLILYEKNSHKEEYPASITKIMTTLLAIENCSMGEIVTFSHNAIFGIESGSSHIGIDVGEKLTMEQCLYAIMLASANEVSWGVGEHIAGTIPAFADMMNKRAKELGCLNTHFVNANGLHDDDHYTSAYDMALISRAAMQYSTFRTITSTKRYTIPPTNKHENENIFLNHHQMLNGYKYPKYEYEYCIGGKTGYTTKAASTLVTFASKDGIELVSVVMRANGAASKENEYTDTTALFNFGFENYKKYELTNDTVVAEDSPLFTTYSPLFNSETSPLKVGENDCVLLPNDANFNDAKQNISFNNDIKIKNGENIIGTISYTYAGKTVGSTDIIFEKQPTSNLVISQNTKIVDNKEVTSSNRFNLKPIIILGIIAIIALFVWIYFHFNRRNQRKRNAKKYDLRF
ncbi:MAG: D-alanyl-D-alanine carboxypeptidase family protein [Velocimicrobium sp.]